MGKKRHLQAKAPYLNLGCGNHFHPAWVNVDMVALSPEVIEHDLTRDIPFENDCFEVVYHSHVLEHFRKTDALPFLQECCRVCKPGGIIRIAVPDLERICRLYLEKLEAASRGVVGADCDYEWMVLELLDQAVREEPYSEMWRFLHNQHCQNREFIESRIGKTAAVSGDYSENIWKRLRGNIRNLLVARSRWARAFRIGKFRLSGTAHQWMYDRYSLGKLLQLAGFVQPVAQTAISSLVPGWANYHLDTLEEGSVYKPDSLFMEAVKPKVTQR